MPTPPLSDEQCREVWQAYVAADYKAKGAADALGMAGSTFDNRLKRAKERGIHLPQGMQESMTAANLDGMTIDGGWIISDADGNVIKRSTRYSAKAHETQEDVLDRIRSAFEGMIAAPVIAAPEHCDSDLLTVFPIADLHAGMRAWGQETGEDYDTQIATDRLRTWIARAVDASPASGEAVILGLGDILHADDQTNMTPRSKHILDVDTRHFKTLYMTIAALAYSVEYCAAKHEHVTVRILPGNHDQTAYLALMFALSERFRDNPRITVQKVPGEFWVHRFGRCLFAAHHGHGGKPERMVMYLADQYAAEWGQTVHRFLFSGHLHHLKSADIGGVEWRQLRALTAPDAYAASHAYSARAALEASTYHIDHGEVQRVRINA